MNEAIPGLTLIKKYKYGRTFVAIYKNCKKGEDACEE